MKITCIVGSPNPKGSCAYLADTFIKGVDPSRASVKKYCIGDLKINYCLGCKKCYTGGECIQNDDVKGVVLDILTSDYVLIAAPSWWAGVPAQLKTLFDRTTPYGDTNPNRKYQAEKPIKGIAIAVRAGVRKQENELILDAISHYFGHLKIETTERISVCQTDKVSDLLQNHQAEIQKIFDLGKRIGKSV